MASALMEHQKTERILLVDIESLIADADRAGEDGIITTLFTARASLRSDESPSLFLFARSDIENCALVLWHPNEKTEIVVYEEAGACMSQFFASDDAHWLFVVSDGNVQVISLSSGGHQETIALPMKLISSNLEALKIRVSDAYGSSAGNAEEWMAADIVQVGYLESGQLALVTHTGGPADETYGYAYARFGDAWQLIEQTDCGRFDACHFSKLLSQPLNTRPSTLAIWHPNLRTNPYFKSKSVTPDPQGEWAGWDGTIVLEINGKTSSLLYSTGENGHCYEDCVYTRGLRLRLADQNEIVLANYSGNNAIVDRYALVWRQPRGSSELFDLATGESVFGRLQLSGWIQ